MVNSDLDCFLNWRCAGASLNQEREVVKRQLVYASAQTVYPSLPPSSLEALAEPQYVYFSVARSPEDCHLPGISHQVIEEPNLYAGSRSCACGARQNHVPILTLCNALARDVDRQQRFEWVALVLTLVPTTSSCENGQAGAGQKKAPGMVLLLCSTLTVLHCTVVITDSCPVLLQTSHVVGTHIHECDAACGLSYPEMTAGRLFIRRKRCLA